MNKIEHPFSSIAISFSGGGYRAAGFALGSLSYLEEVGLRDNVSAISTVSGGTITGVRYAQSLIQGESFKDFFTAYYNWLIDDKLAGNALINLKSQSKDKNTQKKKNVINAFALAYQNFCGGTIGELEDYLIKHNKDIKFNFNATEFKHGIEFRFKNVLTNEVFGNAKFPSITAESRKKIKFGDVIAASSCFPGGFEPMSFPYDFYDAEDSPFLDQEIGLMDGGIVDNQGISSLITTETIYPLYIISDVCSLEISKPFRFSTFTHFTRMVSLLIHPLFIVLLFSVEVLLISLKWYLLAAFILPFLLIFSIVHIVLNYYTQKVERMMGVSSPINFPASFFPNYILDRVNSLAAMNLDIFLKSGRRKNYKLLFEHVRDPKKIIVNAIYSLRCNNPESKPEGLKKWDTIREITGEIPKNIKEITDQASRFQTTLWFSKDAKKNNIPDKLIVCGQFSTCFNLLSQLIKQFPEEEKPNEIAAIYDQCLSDWNRFKENPYWLLDKQLQQKRQPIVSNWERFKLNFSRAERNNDN